MRSRVRLLVIVVGVVVSCDKGKRNDDEPTAVATEVVVARPAPGCDGGMCGPSCIDLDNDPAHCGACDTACGVDEACAAGVCATQGAWNTIAASHRCHSGKRFAIVCPAGGVAGQVWGTDVYTDDSSICTAAVHAGRLSIEGGGAIAFEMREASTSYLGTTRNGITSHTYGPWQCGFVFVGRDCSTETTRCGGQCVDLLSDAANCGSCGSACAKGESCRKGSCVVGETATWATTPADHGCPKYGAPPATYTYYCPPGMMQFTTWGTDIYTSDSSICTAALHAGKISTGGGVVTIEMRPGLPKYKASTRNGVTTTAYGPWTCSFSFR